jgi:NADPH2:quinone reductase
MRAVTVTRFGGPEVLEVVERPDQPPGPGQVAVAVAVADTLWVETMVRSGAGQNYFPTRPPYVPGNSVAGRISQLGDGVDPALLGREVIARTGGEGGYADRLVVGADAVSAIPGGLSPQEAVALTADATTALVLFDITKVSAGDAVLVVGASGGLGIVSIQLARARGASVVAVARDVKLDRVRELGPDAVVDSERPDWVAAARAALPPGGADVVFDNVGGALGEASFALVADGGRFSAHGTPSGRFAQVDQADARRRNITVTGIQAAQMTAAERLRYTERALTEAAAGHIRPVIGQVFPLEQAAAAHAAIEGRDVFGKTLLTTGRLPA